MTIISYSALRQNLRAVMDAIVEDRTTYEIIRTGQEPVVMLSKHDYDSMSETLYLLSGEVNAQRLHESQKQAAVGNLLHNDLTDD